MIKRVSEEKEIVDCDIAPSPKVSVAQSRRGRASSGKVWADQHLVQRCLANEQEGWEQLYRQCHPRLVVRIGFLLGPEGNNNDLVDEIAARVWYALVRDGGRLLIRFDPERHSLLDGYLMGLARIEILRHARAERRRRSVEFQGGCQLLAETRIPDWEALAMLREFASVLTPGEQEFLHRSLRAREGKEGDAHPLGLSAASTWQRRHRIKLKLRQFFND